MKKIQALAYNSITMFTTLLLILSCNLGIFKNTSTVSFTYGGQSKTTRSIKEVPDVEPNEIIYINGIDSDSPLQHIPLNVGANELELSKKGINLIGFAYNPSVAKGRGKGPKEISSGIMGLGNLSIVTAGLDSLPLAGSAANDFNLGSIAGDSQSYQSLISKTELEQATGYSTDDLDIYSFYDNSFLKLLNPDIDKNGVYDVDEGVYWKLTALRKVPTFYLDDFDKNGPLFTPESIVDNSFGLVFWMGPTFDHPDKSEVFLQFPTDRVYTAVDGTIVTGMAPNHEVPDEGEYGQYYFNRMDEYIDDPVPPFNGDYTLLLGGKTYKFNNLSFLKPTVTGYEGFLFPETQILCDENDFVQKLVYRWWVIDNNQFRLATEAEVGLIVTSFYYYLPKLGITTTEGFGAQYYVNGEIDLARYGIKRSELGGVAGPADSLRCYYSDRGGNGWGTNIYHSKYRPIENSNP